METFWSDITILVPELFMAFSALILLGAGAFLGNHRTDMLSRMVIGVFFVAILFLVGLDWDRAQAFNGFFIFDRFAGFLKLFILGGMGVVTALSMRYLHQEQMARFEYPVLLVLAGLGMCMMVSAGNLLSLYVSLELQSLSLYVLCAFRRNHAASSEAGLKYFVLGALASGMLLFGMSLIYGFTGSIDFAGIALVAKSGASIGVLTGMVFILVGMAFKLSAVPFHMWTPDVYQGAPTSVTALLAMVPKLAAMGLLIRLLFEPFGALMEQWQQIIWFLSAASMIWGAFAAIAQSDIKRLLAYSAIGHMGYALMGVVAGTEGGVGAVLAYMVIYMIMSAGVFGIVLAMRRNELAATRIEDLAGLSQNNPAMAYAMAFLMFSMSGIPPLAGFFGKLIVFQAVVASGHIVLAVIGVLTSVVAAYYYLRVIKVMFFDPAADPFDKVMLPSSRIVVLFSVLFILLFILSPDFLIESGRYAAAILFIG